jgi:RNA polymerase sigma-70 factor (sigma-E family)
VGRYDGFDEFVLAQRSSLSKTAYFLAAGVVADAEDLLQEALTRTAARWPRVRAQGDPTAYVRMVMLNQVRTSWRRRRIVRQDPVSIVPEPRATDHTESEAAGVLWAALRALPPGQRAVLYLRYCEDLSEAETARLLGRSVGTVKSQAHAGLVRLRELAPSLLDGVESEMGE